MRRFDTAATATAGLHADKDAEPETGKLPLRPGLQAVGGECVKELVCGEHSTLNRAGTNCMCKRGYTKKGDMCIPLKREKREKKREKKSDEPRINGAT